MELVKWTLSSCRPLSEGSYDPLGSVMLKVSEVIAPPLLPLVAPVAKYLLIYEALPMKADS